MISKNVYICLKRRFRVASPLAKRVFSTATANGKTRFDLSRRRRCFGSFKSGSLIFRDRQMLCNAQHTFVNDDAVFGWYRNVRSPNKQRKRNFRTPFVRSMQFRILRSFTLNLSSALCSSGLSNCFMSHGSNGYPLSPNQKHNI